MATGEGEMDNLDWLSHPLITEADLIVPFERKKKLDKSGLSM